MLGKILKFARHAMPENENSPGYALRCGAVSAENVRALATGAALAVALDASPAVLVSIYDYAHRSRDHARRLAC